MVGFGLKFFGQRKLLRNNELIIHEFLCALFLFGAAWFFHGAFHISCRYLNFEPFGFPWDFSPKTICEGNFSIFCLLKRIFSFSTMVNHRLNHHLGNFFLTTEQANLANPEISPAFWFRLKPRRWWENSFNEHVPNILNTICLVKL